MIKARELIEIFKPRKVFITEVDGDTIPVTVFAGAAKDISPTTLIRTVIPFEGLPAADFDTNKSTLWIWLSKESRKS